MQGLYYSREWLVENEYKFSEEELPPLGVKLSLYQPIVGIFVTLTINHSPEKIEPSFWWKIV